MTDERHASQRRPRARALQLLRDLKTSTAHANDKGTQPGEFMQDIPKSEACSQHVLLMSLIGLLLLIFLKYHYWFSSSLAFGSLTSLPAFKKLLKADLGEKSDLRV